MTDDDLTLEDIDNVGPSVAEDLENAGFESVADVADASDDDLADVSTFVENRTDEIIASADELTDDNESESTTAEEIVDELEDGEAEVDETVTTDEDDNGPATFDIELELTNEVHPHIISAVIEEQTRSLQRNNHDDVKTMLRFFDALTTAYAEEYGDLRIVEIESITMDELNLFRQAVSTQMTDYRARTGIPRLWGKLQDVVDDIDEIRDANHGA